MAEIRRYSLQGDAAALVPTQRAYLQFNPNGFVEAFRTEAQTLFTGSRRGEMPASIRCKTLAAKAIALQSPLGDSVLDLIHQYFPDIVMQQTMTIT